MRTTSRAVVGAALGLSLLTAASLVSSQPLPGATGAQFFPGAVRPGPATLNQAGPQVQSDGAGHVYRLWVDEAGGRDRHVRFQRSNDGGKTWLPEALVLDRDKPDTAWSTSPVMAHDAAGHVMVIWRTRFQDAPPRKELRVLASADRGATWPGPAVALNRGGGALQGEINTDGQGHVYVAWSDERRDRGAQEGRGGTSRDIRIFFNKSDDYGKTWLPEDVQVTGLVPESEEATAPGVQAEQPAKERERADRERRSRRERREPGVRPRGAGYSFQPRLASDRQGRVFLAWVDTRAGDANIYFRVSDDHGKTWGPETNVSRGARGATSHQLLTDGRGGGFLLWSDRRHGLEAEDVFFSRSGDGGKTWEPPTRLSRRPAGATLSTLPAMARGPDGRLYVAWADGRNGREDIYVNVSADGGRSWLEQDVRLDRDEAGTGISRDPIVITGGPGEVAVLWTDDRTGFEQILMSRSTDGGRTWSAREVRVDTNAGPKQRALRPRAAWDPSGTLHVVWEVATGELPQMERRVGYVQLRLTP